MTAVLQRVKGRRRGSPRRYDHDAVLDMWEAGWTCGMIAEDLKMPRPETVSVIVQAARKRGDARAVRRVGQGTVIQASISLDALEAELLRRSADARNTTSYALLQRVIKAAIKHQLIGAILDDGVTG
jgi:hypothetical protein